MFRIEARTYPEICVAVVTAFQLVPDNSLVTDGMNVVFRDYRRREEIVELAWDNWTGFTVAARNLESESLVREIGDYLLQSQWVVES